MIWFKSISYKQKKPTTLVLLNQAILDNYSRSYTNSDSPSPHLPISLSPHLPYSLQPLTPHLPISPSPHLPTPPTPPSLSRLPTPDSRLPTPDSLLH
ncbi:hypothetical protein [Moorena sp. SIO4G3]|uniref:hypothetical protein n=1 Tax=Moorena sp. SIO4G3 TaxID=2607821 RepID=UPI00142CDE7E|nr:hypothetical protein [Moorena sp. SIO4G3]NEO77376.1 hypothetical protein [Moorena sp. SIO4G3]